jgi:hypothetical protein
MEIAHISLWHEIMASYDGRKVRDTEVDTDAITSQSRWNPMWGRDFILPPAF